MDELKQLQETTQEVSKEIKALSDKFVGTQDEFKKLNDSNKLSNEKYEKLEKAMKEQGESLKELTKLQNELKTESFDKSFGREFNEFLTDKHEEIKELYKNKDSKPIIFVPKAVAPITTASGSDAAQFSHLLHSNPSPIEYRNDNGLIAMCNVIDVSEGAVHTYSEAAPKEGGYSMVAEGGAKPGMDFAWVNRQAEAKKAAAHTVLTEESIKDVKQMRSIATRNLKDRHDLFKVEKIYFGTGIGEEPEGATVAARQYTLAALNDSIPNGKSNIMDIVNAMAGDMYVTTNFVDGINYRPTNCLINPIDFIKNFVYAKDGMDRPLFPQALLFNAVNLGGFVVKPWVKIPAGKIFIGDMSMYNISNYEPYSIRIGWINDQFTNNQFTMVGESRFHAYIKNFHKNAFMYDDVSTVKLAIEAA